MHGACKATMTQEYNIGVNLIVNVTGPPGALLFDRDQRSH